MSDKEKLEVAVKALTEIRDIAAISEDVEFYAMLADKALQALED